MKDDSLGGNPLENYEMVHVPMEDAWDLQLRKILGLDAERCTLFLYDRKTNELFSRVAMGPNDDSVPPPA